MRIELPSGTPAELVRPSGDVSRGLVVMPDIGGLRPLFDDLFAGLADEHGWAICAPEPWPGRQHLDLEGRLASVGTLVDEEVLGDLLAAADATEADPVAVMGFCMGGMYALKAAGTGRFDRAVSFYGMIRVPEQWASPTQGQPLEALAADQVADVLAIVGTNDVWTPLDDLDALEATGAEVVRYEGAEHGFVHDPSRPAHRPDDAADAWARVVAFLQV